MLVVIHVGRVFSGLIQGVCPLHARLPYAHGTYKHALFALGQWPPVDVSLTLSNLVARSYRAHFDRHSHYVLWRRVRTIDVTCVPELIDSRFTKTFLVSWE